MESVAVLKEVRYPVRGHAGPVWSEYSIDLWLEIKRRWMVFGVLIAVALAVLAPNAGAPGGALHSEYLSYVPLSYIYYTSGRSYAKGALSAGALTPGALSAGAVCAAHAHCVAPALSAVIVTAFRDAIDYRVVKGMLLSSAGAGCGWLSLSLCTSGASLRLAPTLLLANYVTSLIATPALMIIICGRAVVPHIGGILFDALTTLFPFLIGALHSHAQKRTHKHTDTHLHTHSHTNTQSHTKTYSHNNTHQNGSKNNKHTHSQYKTESDKVNYNNNYKSIDGVTEFSSNTECKVSDSVGVSVCALVLVYCECCGRLREAEGSLYVGDVLLTLFLGICVLCAGCASVRVYARAGLVRAEHALPLALCAVPKCLYAGWQSSSSCTQSGLSLLPSAFLAPTQALLLAALATHAP